jgi:hypothetical protein
VAHLTLSELGLAALPPPDDRPSPLSEYLRRQVEARRAALAPRAIVATPPPPPPPEEKPVVKALAVVGALALGAAVGRKLGWL